MSTLQVHKGLLGAKLRSSHGKIYTIIAAWLESSERSTQSQFTVLVIGSDGECFKEYLPDPNMTVDLDRGTIGI